MRNNKKLKHQRQARILKQALQIIEGHVDKPCKMIAFNCAICQVYMLISLLDDYIDFWKECDVIEEFEAMLNEK